MKLAKIQRRKKSPTVLDVDKVYRYNLIFLVYWVFNKAFNSKEIAIVHEEHD